MNFRISVTHLRIALLIANFGLAGGLVGMAGKSMMDASGTVSTVRVFEPSHFEYSEAESFDTQTKSTIIQPVADWIDPPPKPVITPPASGTEDETDEPATTGPGGPEFGGPGPLAEEWEYVFYILFPDAPREGFVRLRRKGTEPAAQATSTRARIIRGRRGLQRGAAARARPGAGNELSFFIKDRHIKDEDKEVEFLVDEATPAYLAYRTPDRLNTIYRLPHADDSSMADWPTRTDLRLSPREVEEPEAEEGEEAPKKPMIQIIPPDFQDRREEEYQQIISGGINSLSNAPNLTGSTIEDATPDEEKEEGEGAGNTSVRRFSGGAPQPAISQEEGLRNLRAEMQKRRASGEMTAEDEKLLQDAMTGKLKTPPKK